MEWRAAPQAQTGRSAPPDLIHGDYGSARTSSAVSSLASPALSATADESPRPSDIRWAAWLRLSGLMGVLGVSLRISAALCGHRIRSSPRVSEARRFDLTDAVLEPLLPQPARWGRTSLWSKRQLIDGIRWEVRPDDDQQRRSPGALCLPKMSSMQVTRAWWYSLRMLPSSRLRRI